MTTKKRVFIFGLDGASPELIFDKWIDDLPNIKKLINNGTSGKLNSSIPPSTVIAWNSMLSGKDVSEIGIHGYTYRDSQGNSKIVDSTKIKCNLIWDILSKENKKTISLFVPLTYPVKPINGKIVSGFLTPHLNGEFAYPSELKEKIKSSKNPKFFFDVAVGLAGHKGMGVDKLLEKTYEMTDMQIELLKELLKEDWDFFIGVMIGTDRLQHMLWRHFDKSHRRFIENSPYKNSLKEYYQYLDKKLGEILKLLDEDTTIIVASDHGMVKQEGKINLNNWLIKEGYLVLKKEISEKTRFSPELVNMEETIAYSSGAYNARVYFNRRKIEENYENIKNELINKIKAIPDDKGNKLNTEVYETKDIYKDNSDSECPDLIVYFDNLKWASNPDLGQEGIYSWESAVGADSAGHSKQGIFIAKGPNIKKKYVGDIDIREIYPTILSLLNVPIPEDTGVNPLKIFNNELGQYYESSLIDSTDNMQFKVYSNSHPSDFIIAKPKYIPTNLIEFEGLKKRFMFSKCMNRFNLFKKKEIVERNLKKLNENYPEYIYYCKKHKNWFLGVPKNKIKKFYDCKEGLNQLLRVPVEDLDDYLKSTRQLIDFLSESGVSQESMGISHSTLLGNYTPGKSDIDLIVFGKDNGWKIINFLEQAQHPLLKWKTSEEWAKYYNERVVSDYFNEQEYVFNMVRKRDDGLFNNHVFSIFVVENPNELTYNWEDEHFPLSTVKVQATVKDDFNSIVRPGFYELEDSKILEGYENVPVKKLVNWARPFTLQVKKGEKFEAVGLLEKVKSKTEEYYQLVLGYFDTYTTDRGKKEYLKALI